MKRLILLAIMFAHCGVLLPSFSGQTASSPRSSQTLQTTGTHGMLPLRFEANRGQADGQAQFVSRGSGYTVSLTSRGMKLFLRPSRGAAPTSAGVAATAPSLNVGEPFSPKVPRHFREKGKRAYVALTIDLVGAARASRTVGENRLRTRVNYFVGNDPSKWLTNVPTYASVRYQNVYPGIDLVYYGNRGRVEYDFVVAPNADPNQIQFAVSGADGVELIPSGDLVLSKDGTRLLLRSPAIYEQGGGSKRQIPGGYSLIDSTHVRFTIAPHDRSQALVVDPVLEYSTFIGGSGDDEAYALAVDAAGDTYVTGITDSPDFPLATLGSFNSTQTRMFVAKLDPTGSSLLFVDYLGGSSGNDWSTGLALDPSGNAYVTGSTGSADFPTVQPYQAGLTGHQDAFLTKLSADGSSIVFSTYLGGSDVEYGNTIAVDSNGQAIVAGVTYSQDFPLANAFQSSVVAGENGNWGCYGYITKFSADGGSLVYSTYLAGSTLADNSPNYSYNGPFSQINAVSVDPDGNAYAVGNTNTTDFPVTQAAFMPSFPGTSATSVGFLSKLSSSGVIGYSTYLGGTDHNYLSAVTVDASGSAYVAGWDSGKGNFPVTSTGICDPSSRSCSGGTVTKFDSSGSNILYSTYLASNNDMAGDGIQVDASGNAFILSNSTNDQYGLTNPIQNYAGGGDAIIIELDPSGNSELFASFVGGSQFEMGSAIALDTHRAVYVAGTTLSADFPTTQSAFQNTLGGEEDAFVVKIGISEPIPAATANISPADLAFPATALGLTSGSESFTITNTGAAVLNVTGIQVSGDFAVLDSTCGAVAASEACTVSVTFTPTTSGPRTGGITIVDTASDSPQTVTLIGAGLDFALSAVNADATVISGGTGSYVLHLTAVGGSFSSPVTFACSGAGDTLRDRLRWFKPRIADGWPIPVEAGWNVRIAGDWVFAKPTAYGVFDINCAVNRVPVISRLFRKSGRRYSQSPLFGTVELICAK